LRIHLYAAFKTYANTSIYEFIFTNRILSRIKLEIIEPRNSYFWKAHNFWNPPKTAIHKLIMKMFGPFVLAALAAVHGVDAVISDTEVDGPPRELGGRMLSNVGDIAVPISRNTQGCTSVAVLGPTGIAPGKVLIAMGMVNGQASCNRNYCNALYMTSNDEPTIIAELGNFDLLIVLNESNHDPPLTAGNKALVDTALGNGSLKGLMVYDRYAQQDPNVPGLQSGKTNLSIILMARCA